MAETISYKLENFEGPLDLLLHLIEKNKINIYDIPIAKIAQQYLEFMRNAEVPDLDIMSEFLVMAATLLDIKARLLLPKEIDEESGEEIDPREELVQRLIEYKKYKIMAKELADREFIGDRILYRSCELPDEITEYEIPPDLDLIFSGIELYRLKEIYDQIIKRKENRIDKRRSDFGTIKKDSISLNERIHSLLQYARREKSLSFYELLEEQPSKIDLVITFLALLELMKLGKISLIQGEKSEDMQIEIREKEGEEEEIDFAEVEDV